MMATATKKSLENINSSVSLFVLLRDYFNSYNLYKNDELPRNQIVRFGFQVKNWTMKNLPSCSHVLHKTLNVVISRHCFAEDGKEMYHNVKRTCRAIVFAHKTYCRCRRRCLSSLMSLFSSDPMTFPESNGFRYKTDVHFPF